MEYLLYSIIFSVSAILVAFFLEWFDRKVYARIQHRVGPKITGPHGVLQPIADFIKLLTKEDCLVKGSDTLLLDMGPVLSVAFVLFSLFFIPFGYSEGLLSIPGDLIIIIVLSSFVAVMILLTGYAQKSAYANVGAARWAELFISFEIPFVISLASITVASRSITISEIISWQAHNLPLIVIAPIALVTFIFSSLAKLEKTPFDIPEAETEIAAGWMVELSGRKLAFFRLTKDLEYLLLSALGAVIFLGGPIGPSLPGLELIFGIIWMAIKTIIFALVFSILRGLVARYRIDQAIHLFWHKVIPLTFFQLIIIVILGLFGFI